MAAGKQVHITTQILGHAWRPCVQQPLIPSMPTSARWAPDTQRIVCCTPPSHVCHTTPPQRRCVEYAPGVTVDIQEGALGDGLGARVWLVAHLLARQLAHTPSLVAGKHVLELGAGCGVVGITAAKVRTGVHTVPGCCNGARLHYVASVHMHITTTLLPHTTPLLPLRWVLRVWCSPTWSTQCWTTSVPALPSTPPRTPVHKTTTLSRCSLTLRTLRAVMMRRACLGVQGRHGARYGMMPHGLAAL